MSTVKLTISEILGASRALGQLDGYTKATEQGAAQVPYNLDDSTRWNIAKNRRILSAEIESYEEVRIKMVRELSPKEANIGKESAEVQEAFRERIKTLLHTTVELPGFLRLKKASVLTGNPIPGSVLELLLPIIDET